MMVDLALPLNCNCDVCIAACRSGIKCSCLPLTHLFVKTHMMPFFSHRLKIPRLFWKFLAVFFPFEH